MYTIIGAYTSGTIIRIIRADQWRASILCRPDLIAPIACLQWAWQLLVNRQCLDIGNPTEKVYNHTASTTAGEVCYLRLPCSVGNKD